MSDAEEAFAFHLRVAAHAGVPKPEREYRFHPSRRWRFDFAWPAQKLAVEIEGGTFSGGRHTRGSGFEADAEKYAEAVLAGWRVLRVSTAMVTDGRALRLVERAFRP
jgi:very-short-patch-repair endonuclease